MELTKHIIIGMGEVGKSLYEVVKDHWTVDYIDLETKDVNFPEYDVLHICIPYSNKFLDVIKYYQQEFHPKFTIIHSTVPVGTSTRCNALHSPIRGLHPNLQEGIKQFVKFIGGSEASEVADYFRKAGIRVSLYDKSETTEAMKLFDTEYYRSCIEFCHRVKKYCDEHNLNFHEVYTLPNMTYNEGYTQLGHPEFVRPVLQPIMKPIGGHCLIPNSKMI